MRAGGCSADMFPLKRQMDSCSQTTRSSDALCTWSCNICGHTGDALTRARTYGHVLLDVYVYV